MNDRIDFILKKCQFALLQHTDSEDISSLAVALIFIVLMVMIAVAAVTIKYGSQTRYLIFTVVTIFLFLFYRLKMSKAATANKLLASYSSIDPNSKMEYGKALSLYLVSGFELKITRTKVVMLFYTILTPLFMVSVSDFLYGVMTDKQLLVSLLISLPFSWLLWRWCFSEDLNNFTLLKEEHEKYLKEIS